MTPTESRKKYYEANKDKWQEYYAAQKNDPEYIKRTRESTKRYRQSNPEKRLLTAAKSRAKQMGLDFDLDLGDIVIPEFCPVLGMKLEVTQGRRAQPGSPSLDRIVPVLGYTKGNVQVISNKANTMKNNATICELRDFATWILANLSEPSI